MFNASSLRIVGLLIAVSSTGCPRPQTPDTTPAQNESGTVLLNGVPVKVKWSDGDTFRIVSGEHEGKNARLAGFNTLEDYGPVHRWGTWTHQELFELARAPGPSLSSRSWTCVSSGKADKYQRLLVECADVSATLVTQGLAMVFGVEAEPDARLVALQQAAQREGRGMWKKGVPPMIVSSVHSAAEGRGYNRIVDTATGAAKVRNHDETYETCQEVCEGPPDQQSCMRYVPYELRYKNKPDCLR